MNYDSWLDSLPGGPNDPEPEPTEWERDQMAFHALSGRTKFRLRRLAKRSTQRRKQNSKWRRRQRREDINAQILY